MIILKNLGMVPVFYLSLSKQSSQGHGVFKCWLKNRTVEFNASARAKQLLYQTGIIQTEEEQRGVNQVLNAAALTYVAGLITAVMQLLYYVFLVGGMGGRRRD